MDEHDHIDAEDVQALEHEQHIEPGEEYGKGPNLPLDGVERVEHAKVGEGQHENDRQRVQHDLHIALELIPKTTLLLI